MSIKHVILAFLSESPQSGYDLKKKFSDSGLLQGLGNSNQIYKALVDLHAELLVTVEVHSHGKKLLRKIYTITPQGLTALQQWSLTAPEIPQFRNVPLMKLMWSEQVGSDVVSNMLATYEQDVQAHLLILREQMRQTGLDSQSQPEKARLKMRMAARWVALYELELQWVREQRQELYGQSDA